MRIAYLTRTIHFSAAHRYHRPEWSDEENQRVFGPCSNPHGHGHNYTLEVMVEGEIEPETGFSVDLASLDEILQREVVERFDHHHINHQIEEFHYGRAIPTTENILAYLWPRIEAELSPPARLYRLRLYEDPTLFADYYGGRRRPER